MVGAAHPFEGLRPSSRTPSGLPRRTGGPDPGAGPSGAPPAVPVRERPAWDPGDAAAEVAAGLLAPVAGMPLLLDAAVRVLTRGECEPDRVPGLLGVPESVLSLDELSAWLDTQEAEGFAAPWGEAGLARLRILLRGLEPRRVHAALQREALRIVARHAEAVRQRRHEEAREEVEAAWSECDAQVALLQRQIALLQQQTAHEVTARLDRLAQVEQELRFAEARLRAAAERGPRR